MDKQEFGKLFKKFMIQESKSLKERFDNDDDDLGIYSADFDPNEFGGDAMKAAMKDIGDEFEPLGKSKFEKNLSIDDFVADLQRQNLNLPKDKEELSGIEKMMNKKKSHEKKFGAGSLNETGEWSDDEEGIAWIEALKNDLEWVEGMLTPGLPFIIKDIRGFDKYQGPYAIVEISGDIYKIWTLENHDLWIEDFPIDNTSASGNRPGFQGDATAVADAINQQYSILAHMNEWTEEQEGPQPGDAEYHNDFVKMPTGLSKFSDIDWVAIYEALTSGEDLSRNDMMEAGLTKEDLDLLYHHNVISAYSYVTLWEENTSLETFLKQVEDAYKQGFNESINEIKRDVYDTTSLYKFLKDIFYTFTEGDGSHLNYAEAAKFTEEELNKNFNITKKSQIAFGLNEGHVNPDTKIDRPKDAEGNPITLKARVEDIKTGNVGRVIRFGVDDNGKMTVHVGWMGEFGGQIPKSIVGLDTIVVRDANRIVREDKEEGEAYPPNSRYMFFGNLEQIQRQAGLILDMDEEKINGILEGGHDWAQDHIGVAKENMDQVFDFLMNETKNEEEVDGFEKEIEESTIRSHANGRGQNIKPGNFPRNLKRVGLKENLDQATSVNDEVFLVVDNDFNRAHYKDLIGKIFDDAPGYAQVKVISKSEVPVAEDFDYAAAEREHAGQEELASLQSDAMQTVPENLIQFLVPNSFTSNANGYSFLLKIPKQANELLKDIELFVKEEIGIDKNISLYTELEKLSNKWIIDVKVSA